MNDDVRFAEIELVQQHIIDALVRTNPPTTLSEKEQDNLLAQACAEACGILDRWVKSSTWKELRPNKRGPIADVIQDWQEIRPFLAPLGVALGRMSERRPSAPGIAEIGEPEKYINNLVTQTEATSRRHPKFDPADLYEDATKRIESLRSSVCSIAGDFAKDIKKSRSRLRAVARTVLRHVGNFLVAAALISVGVTTQAAAHDMSAAVHEAVSVVFVHQAAHTAQPTMRVAPPQVGPQLGPRLG